MKEIERTNLNTPYCKISQAVALTGISKYSLRKGVDSGEIPGFRLGKIYYIDVEKLLNRSGVER